MTTAATPTKSRTSRLNVILPTTLLDQLREKAEREHTTLTELLRYALGLLFYVDAQRKQGARLELTWPDGRKTEIIPRFQDDEVEEQVAAGAV